MKRDMRLNVVCPTWTWKSLVSAGPDSLVEILKLPVADIMGAADRLDGVQLCSEVNPADPTGDPLVGAYVRVVFVDGSKKLFRFVAVNFKWLLVKED